MSYTGGTDDVVLRDAEEDDKKEIIAHLSRIWGEEEADYRDKSWNWLFRENPLTNGTLPPIYILVSGDGKVHGITMSTPVPLLLGGKRVIMSWYGGISLDESYRNRNHALKFPLRMRETRQNGFAIVLERTLPLYRRCSKGSEQLLVVGKFGLVSRFLKLDQFLPAWIPGKLLNPLFTVGSMIYDGLMKGFHRGFEIEQVDSFGKEFDAWCEKVKPGYKDLILIDYSSEFLNWRYSDTSSRIYSRYILKYRGTIRGFFVLETYETNGNKVCSFADMFAARDDGAAFRMIIAGGIAEARKKGVYVVKMLESYIPEIQKFYRRFGFIPGRSSRHPMVIYPPAGSDLSFAADASSYFICSGFADPKVL